MAKEVRRSNVQSRPDGPDQTGESGGGPYPNPHSSGKRKPDFKGGDSDHSYYCGDRLPDSDVNATTRES